MDSIRRLTPSRRASIRAVAPTSEVRNTNSSSCELAPTSNCPRSAGNSASPTVLARTVTAGSSVTTVPAVSSACSNGAPVCSAVNRAARSSAACSSTTARTVIPTCWPYASGRARYRRSTAPPFRTVWS